MNLLKIIGKSKKKKPKIAKDFVIPTSTLSAKIKKLRSYFKINKLNS